MNMEKLAFLSKEVQEKGFFSKITEAVKKKTKEHGLSKFILYSIATASIPVSVLSMAHVINNASISAKTMDIIMTSKNLAEVSIKYDDALKNDTVFALQNKIATATNKTLIELFDNKTIDKNYDTSKTYLNEYLNEFKKLDTLPIDTKVEIILELCKDMKKDVLNYAQFDKKINNNKLSSDEKKEKYINYLEVEAKTPIKLSKNDSEDMGLNSHNTINRK